MNNTSSNGSIYTGFALSDENKWSRVSSVPYDAIVTYFLIVDYILIGPVIVGNILILISIFRFHRLRSRMHILVGNLALSDLLLGIIFIPYDIFILTHLEYTENKYFCLGRQSILNTFLGCFNSEHLCHLFRKIHGNYTPSFKETGKHSNTVIIAIIAFCWGFAVFLGSLPLLGWNKWEPGIPCDIELTHPKAYKSMMFLTYSASLIANFVMYIKVIRTALRHMEAIQAHPTQRNSPKRVVHSERPMKKNFKKDKIDDASVRSVRNLLGTLLIFGTH